MSMRKRKPVSMQSALRIIRTWAAFQLDTGSITLNAADVVRLCDEALAAAQEQERTP